MGRPGPPTRCCWSRRFAGRPCAVGKTATVSLAGNRYQVDPSLVGCRVELRYDPEDLSQLTVHVQDQVAGIATPLAIGRHTHPAVPQAARPTPQPTGIDYLGLVQTAHEQTTVGHIAYRDLPLPGMQALAPTQDAAEVQEHP